MGFTTGTFPATVTGKTSKQMIQADKTKISFSSSDIELINEQMEATHQDKTIGGKSHWQGVTKIEKTGCNIGSKILLAEQACCP